MKYKRILLKLSGGDLSGKTGFGFDSGFPFCVPKTLSERIILGQELWKLRKKVLPGISISNFQAINHNHNSNRTTKYSPYNSEIDNLLNFYQEINDSNFECIHIQCPILLIHIDKLKRAGIKPHMPKLKYIESNGSYLSSDDIKVIEDYFDVKVVNQYGMIETWPIGLAYEDNKFLINGSSIFLEIIDNNGSKITTDHITGKIVVTTLKTKLMPFIRYETGDYGYYPSSDKKFISLEQGREYSLIKGVNGLLFGTKEFNKIINNICAKNISTPEHIQIFQEYDDKFNLYMSKVDNSILFLKEFKKQTEKLLNRKTHVFWGIINDNDIWEIKHSNEKYHLFINQTIPGWVEKANNSELFEFIS